MTSPKRKEATMKIVGLVIKTAGVLIALTITVLVMIGI
jgi:hypothetical protein